MKMTIYDNSCNVHGSRSSYRALNVNRKGGIVLTCILVKEQDIKEGSTVYFAKDEDNGNWYMRFSQGGDGMIIREQKANRGEAPWRVSCKAVAMQLLEATNSRTGCTLLVSRSPTIIDNEKWYQILVKKPLRTN